MSHRTFWSSYSPETIRTLVCAESACAGAWADGTKLILRKKVPIEDNKGCARSMLFELSDMREVDVGITWGRIHDEELMRKIKPRRMGYKCSVFQKDIITPRETSA